METADLENAKPVKIADLENVNDLGVRRRGQRRRVTTQVIGESLTKQADVDRANIQKVLDKYKRTGLVPSRVAAPLEGPLPDVESFHDGMNKIVAARQVFDALPSGIRQKFDNKVDKFLAYTADEKNRDEMTKLGLLKPADASKNTSPPAAPPSNGNAGGAGEGA